MLTFHVPVKLKLQIDVDGKITRGNCCYMKGAACDFLACVDQTLLMQNCLFFHQPDKTNELDYLCGKRHIKMR